MKYFAPCNASRESLVHDYHQAGHFGRDAVYNKLYADGYWWPEMRRMISEELAKCDACIRFVVTKAGYHPAGSIMASLPGDHWQIDCTSHMPESDDGHTAMLVVVDVCTGMVLLLKPMKDITAVNVARKLLKLMMLIGPPKILQSDNGPEFSNDVIRALVKLMGIQHRHISPYNPRADGKVERTIGTITMVIKKMLYGTLSHWHLFVPFAQLHFNDKISAVTGSSPFSLFFGRKMNLLIDYNINNNDRLAHHMHNSAAAAAEAPMIDLKDWQEHQEKMLSLVYPAISNRVKLLKDAMMKRIDKYRRILTASIPTGAIVMVLDPHRKDKFEPKYVGPYTVIRRAQNGAYVLKDQSNDILDRHVPADQLKLIAKSARSIDKEDEGRVFVVDHIEDHRGNPGSYEFLTYWKGYSEPTWLHEKNFIDHDCIKKYWKKTKIKQPRRKLNKIINESESDKKLQSHDHNQKIAKIIPAHIAQFTSIPIADWGTEELN